MNYLEVRGRPVGAVPDPTGELYVQLGMRYGDSDQQGAGGQCQPRHPGDEHRAVHSLLRKITKILRISCRKFNPVRARARHGGSWRTTRRSQDLTSYFPAPLAALRTLKCDVAVGVDRDRLAHLESTAPGWRTDGTHAVVHVRP
ncbi:hypothetical protein [Promicromonospora soli]